MRTKTRWLVLATVSILAIVLAFVLVNALKKTRRTARQTLCVHNLKYFSIALNEYAEDHEGRFPDRVSTLYPEYLPMLEVYVCPELAVTRTRKWSGPHPFSANSTPDEIDSMCSYELVPGLTTADDESTIIMYEKVDNHGGMGRSLLYRDGHGAWEPPENWRDGPPNETLPDGFYAE